MRAPGLLAFVVLLSGALQTVSAQGLVSGPRVELGLGGTFIGGAFDVSDFQADVQLATGGVSPSVGVNLSERFGIEGAVVVDRVEGERVLTYEASLVISRVRRPQSHWVRFLRLGAGGHCEFEHVTESQHENQDGSITAYPAYDHKKLTAPNFFLITTGIRYVVGRRLAIRAEGGGVVGTPGIGIQASVGIVVPIGSFATP